MVRQHQCGVRIRATVAKPPSFVNPLPYIPNCGPYLGRHLFCVFRQITYCDPELRIEIRSYIVNRPPIPTKGL